MDREKVIDGIEETISYLRCHVGTHIERLIQHQNDAITMLKEQPEIVRCKDCKHRGNSEKCVLSAISEEKDFPLFMLDNRGNWFCADGKRKDT